MNTHPNRVIHRAEAHALLKINNALVANLDRESLFNAVSESLAAVVEFDRASLVLLDRTSGMIEINALVSNPTTEKLLPVGTMWPLRGSHLEPVFRERRPLIRRHLDRVPLIGGEVQLLKLGFRSYVAVPLSTRGDPFGCLNIARREPETYSDYDIDFLGEVAVQVALAVENMLAFEQINQLKTQLEQEAAGLEKRVAERTAELEAFSYSVSHDLRAPLRAIDGFSRILLDDYSDKLDPECNRLLNVISRNTFNMGQLIDDLLAFSRLGRQEMKLQEVDMAELAKSVFEELTPMVSDRAISLNVRDLPRSHADGALIQHVFANLLSNAIKFTRMRETAIIDVGYEIEDSENVYYVKDNGVGFDMRFVEKIFGVFQRLHGADEFEGTGVGLAIVQSIIQRHGGRVWADAKVNEGATIYFSLPRRESKKW